MGFFKSLSNKPTPKEVAKDRLKLILIHDRGEIPPETIKKIKVLPPINNKSRFIVTFVC